MPTAATTDVEYGAYLVVVLKVAELHGVGGVGDDDDLVEAGGHVFDERLFFIGQHEVVLVRFAILIRVESHVVVVFIDGLLGNARSVAAFAAFAGKYDERRVVIELCRAVYRAGEVGDFGADPGRILLIESLERGVYLEARMSERVCNRFVAAAAVAAPCARAVRCADKIVCLDAEHADPLAAFHGKSFVLVLEQ